MTVDPVTTDDYASGVPEREGGMEFEVEDVRVSMPLSRFEELSRAEKLARTKVDQVEDVVTRHRALRVLVSHLMTTGLFGDEGDAGEEGSLLSEDGQPKRMSELAGVLCTVLTSLSEELERSEARRQTAEQSIRSARAALLATHFFRPEYLGDEDAVGFEVAPRIVELWEWVHTLVTDFFLVRENDPRPLDEVRQRLTEGYRVWQAEVMLPNAEFQVCDTHPLGVPGFFGRLPAPLGSGLVRFLVTPARTEDGRWNGQGGPRSVTLSRLAAFGVALRALRENRRLMVRALREKTPCSENPGAEVVVPGVGLVWIAGYDLMRLVAKLLGDGDGDTSVAAGVTEGAE